MNENTLDKLTDFNPNEENFIDKIKKLPSLIANNKISLSIPPNKDDADMLVTRLIEGFLFYKDENETLKKNFKDFGNELSNHKETISHLERNLRHSTAHILNLQTAFNECRNWFSNVEEDDDRGFPDVDYSDCSGSDALDLKQLTEELAMNSFERWFTFAKEKYKLETLNDYEKFVDENLTPTLLFIGKKEEK